MINEARGEIDNTTGAWYQDISGCPGVSSFRFIPEYDAWGWGNSIYIKGNEIIARNGGGTSIFPAGNTDASSNIGNFDPNNYHPFQGNGYISKPAPLFLGVTGTDQRVWIGADLQVGGTCIRIT